MPTAALLLAAVALHPSVRQTLRGLDASCAGLAPCAACAEGVHAITRLEAADLLGLATPNLQNKVMRLCEHDLGTVERIFATLPEADATSLTTLLEARVRNGDLDSAVAAMTCCGALAPRPRSCIDALHACCEHGRVDLALAAWDSLQRREVSLDTPSFCLLLVTLSSARDMAAVKSVAQAMAEGGNAPSAEALAAVESAASAELDGAAAASGFEYVASIVAYKKINRSHTRTHRQRTTPPTPRIGLREDGYAGPTWDEHTHVFLCHTTGIRVAYSVWSIVHMTWIHTYSSF